MVGDKNIFSFWTNSLLPTHFSRGSQSPLTSTLSSSTFSWNSLTSPSLTSPVPQFLLPYLKIPLVKAELLTFPSIRSPFWPSSFSLVVLAFSWPRILWVRARVGWFGRMALKHVYYHMWNGSPVQVRCMIQGARDWCTGMTLRDGMGREVEGGFRIRNTCTPRADSCQCMTKPLQYCKIISFQLK